MKVEWENRIFDVVAFDGKKITLKREFCSSIEHVITFLESVKFLDEFITEEEFSV